MREALLIAIIGLLIFVALIIYGFRIIPGL